MKYVVFLCLALIGFSSCNTYLRPAIIGNNIHYAPKPLTSDSVRSKIYISGSYGGAESSMSSETSYELGSIYISKGYTLEDFTFSYGVFGFSGRVSKPYNSNNTSQQKELTNFNKNFSGVGLMTSFGLLTNSSNGRTDFRVLNWENSISKEFGSYLDFRKSLYGDASYENLFVSNSSTVWTTGFSSEIITHIKGRKDVSYGVKLFIGGTPFLRRSFDNNLKGNDLYAVDNNQLSKINVQAAYHLKIKKIYGVFLTDLGIPSASFAFGYAF